ncbi:MAG TPA: hypothetical protein VFC56_16975 [Stellaceae bacterium]|nr:hypothetical protein [Stellaceae bacterium]
MSRWRFLILFAAAAAAGCSALTPFATAPLAADPGIKDAGPRVAICYNLWKTPPEKVQELAQAECLGGTVAQPVDTDYHLDNCPLMTPGRATFICKPK